ncbi:HsdM family class I SAM-dependent methyltransferase [Frankia canadensis]|nr:N-6 DNA methylase [Frankia canadensis]
MKDNVDIAAFARPIDEAADQVRLRARRHDVAEGFESLASRFLLEQTAAAHGPRGGEHVTPLSLSRTIVALLDPQPNARICDPCCVSGELLIAAGTWNRLPGPAVIGRSVLDGSALSPMSRQLTLLSAAIRGLRIDVGASPREPLKGEAEPVSNADAVTSASAADGESTNKITPVPRYDVVLANPPFRMPGWDEGGRLHFPYGEPPTHSATFAWLQYAAAILDDRGRAALVMPTSAAASENPTERRLRAKMTENGAVECVIAMPGELFRENDLDVAVWILRGKDHRSRRDVLLIDARALGTRRRRGRRILTDDDTAKIVGAYRSWRDSAAHTFNTIPGFAVAVDMQQLRVHDWQLNPAVHLHSGLPHADAGATRAKARALHEELLSCEYRARQADADVAHLLAWITP